MLAAWVVSAKASGWCCASGQRPLLASLVCLRDFCDAAADRPAARSDTTTAAARWRDARSHAAARADTATMPAHWRQQHAGLEESRAQTQSRGCLVRRQYVSYLPAASCGASSTLLGHWRSFSSSAVLGQSDVCGTVRAGDAALSGRDGRTADKHPSMKEVGDSMVVRQLTAWCKRPLTCAWVHRLAQVQ